MTADPSPFIPKPVSRHFHRDWQYAVAVTRSPVLRSASLVISVMPIAQQIAPSIPINMTNLWILWSASLAFLVGYAVLTKRCPKFIQEFQTYEDYRSRGHSHRWIVWEFFNNLESVSGWKHIVRESVEKQISIAAATEMDPDVYRASPIFPRASGQDVEVYSPVNLNRDIYLPFRLSHQRFVLSLQESDPDLAAKEKELFWILFSQCAKERPVARNITWILFGAALLLLILSVLNNVLLATSGASFVELSQRFCAFVIRLLWGAE